MSTFSMHISSIFGWKIVVRDDKNKLQMTTQQENSWGHKSRSEQILKIFLVNKMWCNYEKMLCELSYLFISITRFATNISQLINVLPNIP